MRPVKRTIIELACVVAAGLVIGLAANAANPKGIAVNRNHFRASAPVRPSPPAGQLPNQVAEPTGNSPADQIPPTAAPPPATEGPEASDPNWQSLLAAGYQPISHEKVIEWFQDAAYLQERTIFVDARNDDAYQRGHIPGAYQLDHYRLERYLPDVLPPCQNAEKIVVYCNGGDCEDSKLAAADLMDNGIDPNRIFVYIGGVVAWKADGLIFEMGDRLSGEEGYLSE